MQDIIIEPKSTALILIDLQKGIVARDTEPHSSEKVVQNSKLLADQCRLLGIPVFPVHVTFSSNGADRLSPVTDATPFGGSYPADFAQIVPEIGPMEGDFVITKRQWGAFYGTGLDLQLRRRGIKTIILGGISTNFGVESTARDAYERGYDQIFVEDAMAGLSAGAHEFVIKNIFPRIGRVRSTNDVLKALNQS